MAHKPGTEQGTGYRRQNLSDIVSRAQAAKGLAEQESERTVADLRRMASVAAEISHSTEASRAGALAGIRAVAETEAREHRATVATAEATGRLAQLAERQHQVLEAVANSLAALAQETASERDSSRKRWRVGLIVAVLTLMVSAIAASAALVGLF